MSKGNTFENELLALIFQNANIPLIGDATGLRGSTTVGSLFISLHTADPGETGDQTTSECNYTGYARQSLARNSTNFPIAANVASLGAALNFPQPTNTTNLPQTATHVGIGTAASGAGKLLYKGPITPTIVISNTGSQPQLGTGTQVTED